jgi:hypothetical protein
MRNRRLAMRRQKCGGVGWASDIDPDPFWSKWRYREPDPITKF